MFIESNKALFENALDFLEKSLEEFKDSPKYSVLHFAISVEILLKARLSLEHWSLVVSKNAERKSYLEGDFQSVNLDEAVKRLRNVVGEQITDNEFKSFKKLSSHRNKVIHFYHKDIEADNSKEMQKIITEQCECWYHIKTLFTKKWRAHFEDYMKRFEALDWKMRRHWEYLSTVFETVKPDLKKFQKEGRSIDSCSYCHYESVPFETIYPDFLSGNCLVCSWYNTQLKIVCDCGHNIIFENEGFGDCPKCDKKYEPQDVYKKLDADSDDYNTPANCSYCDGYGTVIGFHDQYLCTSCLEIFDELEQCDYCGEYCSGDMSDSSWQGCAVCDGSMGNL